MSLNPEPAAPDERAELNLPPKSYADAAEEALEPESHANGAHGTGKQQKKATSHTINSMTANGISTAARDSEESLEGVGLDASPKSPTAKGHRRKGSRSSTGSVGRKHGEQTDGDVFEKHSHGNGDALVSVKPPRALEQDRRLDVKPTSSELKSGRQAGAGWATSKYASFTPHRTAPPRRG